MTALRLPRLLDQRAKAAYTELMADESGCPYYRGGGTCASGCWTEPSCQTNEPIEGWPLSRPGRVRQTDKTALFERVNAYARIESMRTYPTGTPRVTLRGVRGDLVVRDNRRDLRNWLTEPATPTTDGMAF